MNEYAVSMQLTHPNHMMPLKGPFDGSGILEVERKLGSETVTGAGTFEQALLKSLDKVSGAHQRASALEKEGIINPDSVDVQDITIAQAEASMSLGITRNVLSRLVQGWRDLINLR